MKNNNYKCVDCMEFRNENCFGKDRICKDFRYAPPMPKSSVSNNYTYGFQSYSEQIRLAKQNEQSSQPKPIDKKNSQITAPITSSTTNKTSNKTQPTCLNVPTILDKISALQEFKSSLNSMRRLINPFTHKIIYGIDDKLRGVITDLEEYITACIDVALKKYSNMNTPWTSGEEKQLNKEFLDNIAIDIIAKIHRRSCEEIYNRLQKLNLL